MRLVASSGDSSHAACGTRCVGVDVAVGVAVAVGVRVAVDVRVDVRVKVTVGVRVCVGVRVGVEVQSEVRVGVKVRVDVDVRVGVKVRVDVRVAVGTLCQVFVASQAKARLPIRPLAWRLSVPGELLPVYCTLTLPLASVMPLRVVPALGPEITERPTVTPGAADPLPLRTRTVTVCDVPTGLTSLAGSTVHVGGDDTQVLVAEQDTATPSMILAKLMVSAPAVVPWYVKTTCPLALVTASARIGPCTPSTSTAT